MPVIDVALLLEIIQQYSFIYDKKHPSFKDVAKKNNAWEEIADILTSPVEDVKTRWRTLRERFSKELKNHEDWTRSGKCFEDTSLYWEWFEPMKFLINHVKPRKTCSSKLSENRIFEAQSSQNTTQDSEVMNESNDESQNSESYEGAQYVPESEVNVPSASASTSHTPSVKWTQCSNNSDARAPKRKRPTLSIEKSDIDMELLKTLKQMEKPTEDEDDIFGKMIACELRKVQNTEEKQRRKARMYMIATSLESN